MGANAQVDLSISALLPVDGGEYDNYAAGDTVLLAVEITNLGTTAIVASDTIYMQVGGIYPGSDGQSYNLTFNGGGFEIPAGGVDTFMGYTVQGELIGTTSSGVSVYTEVVNDGIDTFTFTLYARDSEGNLIIESDFVEGAEAGTYSVGANNQITLSATYGTPGDDDPPPPSGILDNTLAATQIQVYPNPANVDINFVHNITKAGAVSAKITDINGRVIYTKDFGVVATGEQHFTISVADLPNGNYVLEISTEDNRGVSKFTVNK